MDGINESVPQIAPRNPDMIVVMYITRNLQDYFSTVANHPADIERRIDLIGALIQTIGDYDRKKLLYRTFNQDIYDIDNLNIDAEDKKKKKKDICNRTFGVINNYLYEFTNADEMNIVAAVR